MNKKVLFLYICLIIFLALDIAFGVGLIVNTSIYRASEGKEEAFSFQEIKNKEDHRVVNMHQEIYLPALVYLICPLVTALGVLDTENIKYYHYFFSSFSNHSPPLFS